RLVERGPGCQILCQPRIDLGHVSDQIRQHIRLHADRAVDQKLIVSSIVEAEKRRFSTEQVADFGERLLPESRTKRAVVDRTDRRRQSPSLDLPHRMPPAPRAGDACGGTPQGRYTSE